MIGNEEHCESSVERLLDEIRDEVRATSDYTGCTKLAERVIEARRQVPRHAFVPDDWQSDAYCNSPLPIGHAQTISQPYIVALMTDLIQPRADDVVLEVGTGPGYQAAVLASHGQAGLLAGNMLGAFLAVYEQGQGNLTLRLRVDSTSPAGFAGGVAIAKEPKATDEKARSIQFLAAFTGGKGPFVAKVWVASVDAAGAPRAFPEDGGGFEASILDPGRQSQAAELQRDDTAPRVSGGRTWVRYSGQLPRDLVGGGMMIMTTGTKGGGFELASPEIVATSATTALSRVPVMRVRPMRESERAAALTYDKIAKRLEAAPAGERAKRPSLAVPYSH